MKRVLLVDDSADGRLALAALLHRRGFVADHASNGAEAIEVAQRSRPDLIVSDLLMPVMDGFTLLNHCKRDPVLRDIPFIVFTGACTDPRDATFATELGADAYLVKPLPADELVMQLEIALEEKGRENELAGLSELELLQHRHRTVLRKLAEKMRLLNKANLELERDIARRVQVERELRESETRFRQLAENIPEVFWIGTPEIDRIAYVSPAYETVWGHSCASLYEDGRSWVGAIHPDDVRGLLDIAFSSTQFEPREARYRIVRPDGEVRWIHTRTFPVREEESPGRSRYIVGVSQDVTEQKRAQEERALLEEQLLQTQKMEAIGTLAGGIAHDFNNILGVIGGNAELALREPDVPENVRLSLDEIVKASKRAMRLVQQILTLSRRQTPELAVYDLRPLVVDAVQLLRSTVPAGVALGAEFHEPIPPILADPTLVHQVLINLVANSWHSFDGGIGRVRVIVDGVKCGDGGVRARLRVEDDGCGMDESLQRRIFEPFFTTKPPGKGTGLGLSVVHGIVTQLGGTISVRSREGEGSTFEMTFPAAVVAAAEPPPAPTTLHAGDGQHVLYLDDEEPLVYLAERMLASQGFRVTGFSRPEDALAAIRSDPAAFDLVVTDYNMPRVSGLQVAGEIRAIAPGLPVMMTSGYITDELREKAAEAGVRHLVEKPDTVDGLCDGVVAALRDSPRS